RDGARRHRDRDAGRRPSASRPPSDLVEGVGTDPRGRVLPPRARRRAHGHLWVRRVGAGAARVEDHPCRVPEPAGRAHEAARLPRERPIDRGDARGVRAGRLMPRGALRLVVLAALLVMAPAAAADQRSVAAGPLTAHIDTNPWHLRFSDSSNRTVLTEALGRGLGYSNGS